MGARDRGRVLLCLEGRFGPCGFCVCRTGHRIGAGARAGSDRARQKRAPAPRRAKLGKRRSRARLPPPPCARARALARRASESSPRATGRYPLVAPDPPSVGALRGGRGGAPGGRRNIWGLRALDICRLGSTRRSKPLNRPAIDRRRGGS